MGRRTVASPIGELVVTATADGVTGLSWAGHDTVVDDDRSTAADAVVDRAVRELGEYFSGARRRFAVPIDRRARRGFRGEVLDLLDLVPFGATVTYAELAARAGRPRAARAVGTAMAMNPIAILVPCHRVVPSGGGVGAYAGGADAKTVLLRLEGSLGDVAGRVDVR